MAGAPRVRQERSTTRETARDPEGDYPLFSGNKRVDMIRKAVFPQQPKKMCGATTFFIALPLAATKRPDYKGATKRHAPFVYRLGRQIFIL